MFTLYLSRPQLHFGAVGRKIISTKHVFALTAYTLVTYIMCIRTGWPGRNGETEMTNIVAAITETTKNIIPANATFAEVVNAVNVSIDYHAGSSLIDDDRFAKIISAFGFDVDVCDCEDPAIFTAEQSKDAARALRQARKSGTLF